MNIELVKAHIALRLAAREKLYKEWSTDLDFDRDKAGKAYNRLKDVLAILEGRTPQYATIEHIVWELNKTVYQLTKHKAVKASQSIEALKAAVKFISSPQKQSS